MTLKKFVRERDKRVKKCLEKKENISAIGIVLTRKLIMVAFKKVMCFVSQNTAWDMPF